uniref:G-protein coupled receptors family 1 profile domain-containing protein n=2 Tax=Cavia porcellus TaxID=10141 RepID=H0VZ74_CAVPO
MAERCSSEGFVSVDPTMTSQGMELTTVNGSDPYLIQPPVEVLIPHLLITIIALVGLPGNAVVISLLGCCMHRNPISVYVLNLAVSDFLFLFWHFIISLLNIIAFLHIYIIYVNIPYIAIIPYLAGLSMLNAISIERCLCVLWPIWYRCHRPRHTSAVVCTLLWALSLLLSLLDWYYAGFLNVLPGNDWWKNIDFIIAAWLIFLFLTLSGSSLALVVRILCGSRRMPLTRLYVTILLTVLAFLICGLPFGIFWFLIAWFEVSNYYFFVATVVLSCVNSCVNPIIYFLIGSFRQKHQTLKLVLQRALQDSPQESASGDRYIQEAPEMLESTVV